MEATTRKGERTGGKHRACGLTELLAHALCDRGRQVEVEHLHHHLPRVLTATRTTNPEQGPDEASLASHDADRLNTELAGRAATVLRGFTLTAKDAPFHVSEHESYTDPYDADFAGLLAAAIAGVSA
ncbi:hypothetical protein ACFYSF_32310 [Streptomyces canus]|uniref:hypothetical protein n=1 Tax=Streptomyces canus TaxID=58343 RepID=UPI0036950452